MADVQHSSMTGADLHESKGASSAAIDTIPTGNGAGSTVWRKVTSPSIDTSSIKNVNKTVVTVFFPDICSTVLGQDRCYFVLPVAATVTKVSSVVFAVTATADCILTCANAAGVSMGTITHTNGAAAGDVKTLTPASNNTFTAGQAMRIVTDGAGSNVVPACVTIEYTIT